jgi:hypothetical protein
MRRFEFMIFAGGIFADFPPPKCGEYRGLFSPIFRRAPGTAYAPGMDVTDLVSTGGTGGLMISEFIAFAGGDVRMVLSVEIGGE